MQISKHKTPFLNLILAKKIFNIVDKIKVLFTCQQTFMKPNNKVGGVILAGGQSRRMDHQNKGLILFMNKPLINYSILAMTPVANEIIISANKHNFMDYLGLNLPVVTDLHSTDLNGPLAGILAALEYYSDFQTLLVAPCDCPLVKQVHLEKLLKSKDYFNAEVAVATDGYNLQPLFLAINTTLKDSLEKFLNDGNRKVASWLRLHAMVRVDFSNQNEMFFNVNSFDDLNQLSKSYVK